LFQQQFRYSQRLEQRKLERIGRDQRGLERSGHHYGRHHQRDLEQRYPERVRRDKRRE
jgi:hypothetical protein